MDRAVITHAHSDHACTGSRAYLAARTGEALLRARVGGKAAIQPLDYGESVALNGVRVSLHPAGHILGSAQVRIESGGEVWVVSGDYKLEPDPTCAAFEPVACDTFVTESTFGLPIYRWPPEAEVFAEIRSWWTANQQAGKASVLFAYSLGKAQRVLAGIEAGLERGRVRSTRTARSRTSAACIAKRASRWLPPHMLAPRPPARIGAAR